MADAEFKQLKYYFGKDLAVLLADKICALYAPFDKRRFVEEVVLAVENQELKQRVETITDALFHQLPSEYAKAAKILSGILGPENEAETGMFKTGYWLMPIAFYVEKYGTRHFDESICLIEEITKRNTGEYAIRPFLIANPQKTLRVMQRWSKSKNVHVRRLAREGLRPRLPWARKIDLFSDDPSPAIAILENLKSDPSAFVRKSVANTLNDFLKENYPYTIALLRCWREGAAEETRWIIKHALRNEIKKNNRDAMKLVQ